MRLRLSEGGRRISERCESVLVAARIQRSIHFCLAPGDGANRHS